LYGKSLLNAGKLERAIDTLENLTEKQPGYSRARMELIKAYLQAGFKEHAAEQCQTGMKNARNKGEYAEFRSLMP
jgi:Flp pilus assembly protein TadD